MILGITGISGAGKQVVATFFERKQWVVLDVDTMAHQLYRPYTHVWRGIVDTFGEKILNQNDTINRVRLSKIVFNADDPEQAEKERQKLNELVHPALKREIQEVVHRHYRRQSNIAVVAALWDELELREITDYILLVRAKIKLCQERIIKRDSIPEKIYEMRVKDYEEPIQPEFKIDNDGTIEELHEKLEALYERIVQMEEFHETSNH